MISVQILNVAVERTGVSITNVNMGLTGTMQRIDSKQGYTTKERKSLTNCLLYLQEDFGFQQLLRSESTDVASPDSSLLTATGGAKRRPMESNHELLLGR